MKYTTTTHVNTEKLFTSSHCVRQNIHIYMSIWTCKYIRPKKRYINLTFEYIWKTKYFAFVINEANAHIHTLISAHVGVVWRSFGSFRREELTDKFVQPCVRYIYVCMHPTNDR